MKLGFVGFGNMAKAIAKGIIEKKALAKEEIYYFDPSAEDPFGVNKMISNAELAKKCDFVILAVKPHLITQVCQEIRGEVRNKPVASIAAGVSTAQIGGVLNNSRLLRIMPNTGAQIGMSYTCFNSESTFKREEIEVFAKLFQALGKVTFIQEKYFNAAMSLSSCGVAFGHMLVESMADGGVLVGLPKAQAVEMASWAVLAACEMILLTGATPAQLKDQICSPGGATIEAVKALENGCLRGTVINAVEKAAEKGNELS